MTFFFLFFLFFSFFIFFFLLFLYLFFILFLYIFFHFFFIFLSFFLYIYFFLFFFYFFISFFIFCIFLEKKSFFFFIFFFFFFFFFFFLIERTWLNPGSEFGSGERNRRNPGLSPNFEPAKPGFGLVRTPNLRGFEVRRKELAFLRSCRSRVIHVLSPNSGQKHNPEVSSIMRELAGRSLTGTYLYSLCVKPGISITSAS